MSDADAPTSIGEAIEKIKSIRENNKSLQDALKGDIDHFLAVTHNSGGRFVRNNWGLWKGHMAIHNISEDKKGTVPECPPLAQEIYDLTGLSHSDDMSGFLFRRVYEEVNSTEVDIYSWLLSVRNHWMTTGTEDVDKYAPLKRTIYNYVHQYRDKALSEDQKEGHQGD